MIYLTNETSLGPITSTGVLGVRFGVMPATSGPWTDRMVLSGYTPPTKVGFKVHPS